MPSAWDKGLNAAIGPGCGSRFSVPHGLRMNFRGGQFYGGRPRRPGRARLIGLTDGAITVPAKLGAGRSVAYCAVLPPVWQRQIVSARTAPSKTPRSGLDSKA
ncbi:hypothetical protein KCP70_02740 [Salmonella enterica subsp. enterica]|nr:hypothetical protein KCP70_02740 [Salmonella enterica subsp. enterica]